MTYFNQDYGEDFKKTFVSVAHTGSVDVESSLSTIELRKVIVEETSRLFKKDNVGIKDNFAHIKSEYNDYMIHLGSGVIHQAAGPTLNILPVHSQHRTSIFLPFVDDDPKTAEIISKVLLLADDKKIKNRFIINQIK